MRFKDILVTIICMLGALLCTYLFYTDLNATLTRLDEQPVGTITYRYNIAQRRFMNRLVWDRLRSDTPVYNGDIIRTDKLSEVIIAFNGGEVVNLYSNTLVQIFVDEEGARIDFSGGTIVVNTPKENAARQVSRRPLVVNSGERQIIPESGTSMRISSIESQLDISYFEEEKWETSYSVIEASFRSPFAPIMELLAESTQIMQNAQRTENVQSIMETIRIIETAQDGNRATETAAVQVTRQQTAPPAAQRRVAAQAAPAATASATTSAETNPAAAAQRPLLPVPGNRIPADGYTITPQMILEAGSLDFSWNRVQGANGYIFTIFRGSGDSRSTVIQTPVIRETSYTLENLRQLARGNFYWQVEAVNVLNNGSIDRRGQIQENRIIVDIPVQQINTRDTGVLYGN